MNSQNTGNTSTTEKQRLARQENVKKAVETRRQLGAKNKELNTAIKDLKKEKVKSIDEEIHKIKQQIEKVRYGKKVQTNDSEKDYRQEYFKLLNKYERLVSLINLEAVIDDIMEDKITDVINEEEPNNYLTETEEE